MFALKFVNIFVCPILSQNVVNAEHGYRYDVACDHHFPAKNLSQYIHSYIHQPQSVQENGNITTYNNF